MSVNDVWIETDDREHIENSFRKETKTFNVVIIAKQFFSIKISFVVNEIVGYVVFFILIDSAIFLTP